MGKQFSVTMPIAIIMVYLWLLDSRVDLPRIK